MKTHRVESAERDYRSLAWSFWFGGSKGDDQIEMHSGFRVVRARVSHQCANWRPDGNPGKHFIASGERCIVESAKYEGKFCRCYTCLPCLDRWAKEIGE